MYAACGPLCSLPCPLRTDYLIYGTGHGNEDTFMYAEMFLAFFLLFYFQMALLICVQCLFAELKEQSKCFVLLSLTVNPL